MSEMAQTADHVIVLGRGRVVADAPIAEFISGGGDRVIVRSPDAARLASALLAERRVGLSLEPAGEHGFAAVGIAAAEVGAVAARHGIVLHELTTATGSLEDAYLKLTRDQVEYAAA